MLGAGDEPLCVCAMHVAGALPGVLALATDDASGLALADLLLGRACGTSTEWGEIERSAAAETTNIIGCAYLNAVAADAGTSDGTPPLMPSPPWFVRDFPEAVMGGIVMTQAASDAIFLTRTSFDIEDSAIRCSLVFVPQALPLDEEPVRPARRP
jgi:chemotaxis protein CheC